VDLKEINIIQLGKRAKKPLKDGVPISNMGYLVSQHEQSKGGRRDEPKEKRAFAGMAVGILLYFP
jgi:hypothetical protein